VGIHSCDCQLQIALIHILIYIINNDYFITTGLSMLALRELQATILSNPHVNRAMRHVAQGEDPCFPLEPLDSGCATSTKLRSSPGSIPYASVLEAVPPHEWDSI